MPRSATRAGALASVLVVLAASVAAAQPVTVPAASPAAEVSQRIGLTDVTVSYHRPLVNDRPIWGALVPYDQPWRAGANENTTVTFGDDVEIEGKPLAAGTYGLHAIPGESSWQIAFSTNHTSWGSFSYDPAEDALRVTVEPGPAPHHEALTYQFEELEPGAATLALYWEKLRVPVRVAVPDLHASVLANARRELRGLAGFGWQAPASAAAYAVANDVALEEALGWAERAIAAEERFETLQTKAQVLEKLGRAEEAEATLARAVEVAATPNQLHFYGRQLLGAGELDEALEVFETNRERFPESWVPYVGLARALSAKGDYPAAAATLRQARDRAPENQKEYLGGLIERLERGEDIN